MADQNRMMNFHSSILQVASIIKNNEQKKAEDSFEMEKKKRERQANYTREETERLVELILTKKHVLENKKNGSDQWREKNQAWKDIAKAFNRKPNRSQYRDSRNLRIKYESLKKDMKKKWSNILAQRRNSDGKLPKFSAIENKLKDLISLPMEGLICDLSSINDKSDDDESSDSTRSDVHTKDFDWSEVKKEYSDDETRNSDGENDTIEFQPLNLGEPPNKRMHEDPLVGKQIQNQCNKDDLEEEKLEAARLQTELLRQEIEIKKLQRKTMEEELAHKKTMHDLEKQHILLKIEALKNVN